MTKQIQKNACQLLLFWFDMTHIMVVKGNYCFWYADLKKIFSKSTKPIGIKCCRNGGVFRVLYPDCSLHFDSAKTLPPRTIRYSESWMSFCKFSPLKVQNQLEPCSAQTQILHIFLIRRKTWSTWEIHSNWMKLSKSLKQYVQLICCLVQYCEIFI